MCTNSYTKEKNGAGEMHSSNPIFETCLEYSKVISKVAFYFIAIGFIPGLLSTMV